MRHLSLRILLIGANVGLVVLAVVLLAVPAVRLLHRVADEQALARVRLAAASGAAALHRSGEEVLTQGRLLSERPTLARLLEEREGRERAAALTEFLERFARTGGLAGCAVMAGGRVIAYGGSELAWGELASAASPGTAELCPTGLAGPGSSSTGGGSLLLVAKVPIPISPRERAAVPVRSRAAGEALGARVMDAPARTSSRAGSSAAQLLRGDRTASGDRAASEERSVVVARLVDDAFDSGLTREIGLPVAILGMSEAARAGSEFTGGAEDARAALLSRVLSSGAADDGRIEGPPRYVAVLPLRSSRGETVGLLEAALSAAPVDGSLKGLVRTLLLVAALIIVLAAVSGALIARRIARPVEGLTRAAVRIGAGDLAIGVPHATGPEMGALSYAVEEMRDRLRELTAQLHGRRAEAEAVIEGIAEGVFAVDRNRRFVYMNPQAATMLGTAAERAAGRFCGDVLNPRDAQGRRPCEESCPILDARFSGASRAVEHLHLPDGRTRTVVIAASPPAGEEGGRQFQVIRDETDLETSRRLRDTVLANISHEFRTPLAAQLASIEMLRDRLPELSVVEARGLVLSLERGTVRLTQLIDNLLESVRIEAGRDSIRRRPVALDEVIEEAVALTAPLLDQKDQTLVVNLPHPMPPVLGDGPRLQQVFVNLLANANKFAPGATVVTIGGEPRGREIAVWVEDEGPGFPDGAGLVLFERFVRSTGTEGSEEPETGGLGLGLWIVKSIVERHGGRVEAGLAGGRSGGGSGGSEGRAGRPMSDAPERGGGARTGRPSVSGTVPGPGGTAAAAGGGGTRLTVVLPCGSDPDQELS